MSGGRTQGAGPERDARLDAIYGAAPDEAPPAMLDDAIRAAARRAVGARPRPAGARFQRWQWPLSIAAVLVLSVSLVVVMREEGGELAQLPQAEVPQPAPPAASADAVPKVELVPQDAPSRNIGLKPPSAARAPGASPYALDAGASGVGMREAGVEQRARQLESPARPSSPAPAMAEKSDLAAALPAESVGANEARARARSALALAPAAQAPASAESRANVVGSVAGPAAEPLAAARKEQVPTDRLERESTGATARRDAPAAPPMRAAALAPMAKSTGDTGELVAELSRLPPAQWLERLEDWRRQGRLADVRAGLAEFRRRYPEHPVPVSLRELAP